MRALEDAYPSILAILLQESEHPVIARLRAKMRGSGNKIPEKTTRFVSSHHCPILPGDASLLPSILVDIQRHYLYLIQTREMVKDDIPIHALIHGAANLLFQIVILRLYLNRSPVDDRTIYHLIAGDRKDESIVRLPCHAEQAVAACDGAQDTRQAHHTDTALLYERILTPGPVDAVWDGPIAHVNTPGGAFQWPLSGDNGLTGGNPAYQRGHIPEVPRRKPKPQPKRRPETAKENENAPDVSSHAWGW